MRAFVHGQVFQVAPVFVKKLAGAGGEFFSRQHEQAIVFLPIPLAFGIFIYFALPEEPALSSGIVPLLLSLFGVVSLSKSRFDNPATYSQWLCLVFFLLELGQPGNGGQRGRNQGLGETLGVFTIEAHDHDGECFWPESQMGIHQLAGKTQQFETADIHRDTGMAQACVHRVG